LGAGTLFGFAGCSNNSSSQKVRVSGRVVDIEEDPVPGAVVEVYVMDHLHRFQNKERSESDDNGNWEMRLNADDLSENDSGEVVVTVKKSEWFDTKGYSIDEFREIIDTGELISQTLSREFILEEAHTATEPSRESDTVNDGQPTYYGTLSIWREFIDGTNIHRIHTMLRGAFTRKVDPTSTKKPWVRMKSGVLSIQLPEDIHKTPVDKLALPIQSGTYPRSTISNTFFTSYLNTASPAVAHQHLRNEYVDSEDLGPSESERLVQATLGGILGPAPAMGAILGTASAVSNIGGALSDPAESTALDNEERFSEEGSEQIAVPDPNRYDTVMYGADIEEGGLGRVAPGGDSFVSMTSSVDIAWEQSEPNQTNITVRGIWKRATRLQHLGPEISAVAFGESISRRPSLPWKESDPDDQTPPTSDDESDSGQGPTPSSGVDCGKNVLADIPGEVVHNGVDSLTVLAHGVCKFTGGANILVKVQNTGDQVLTPELSAGGAENDFSIAARALSSEGNQLDNGQIIAGPAEIKPGTEATLISRAPINRDLAKYELCILTQSLLGISEWENKCGG
jgi:hypothetical protein